MCENRAVGVNLSDFIYHLAVLTYFCTFAAF